MTGSNGRSVGGTKTVDLTPMILETSHEAFVLIGTDGLVRAWNSAAVDTFGWEKGEAIGRALDDLIIPERFRAYHRAALRKFAETGESNVLGRRLQMIAVRRDRTEIPLEFTVSAFEVEGEGTTFGAFLWDISERKKSEQESQLLATIVESSGDAIVSGTPGGRILSWNDGAEALYGYTAEETIGEPITKLLPPETLPLIAEIRDRVMAELPVERVDTRVRRKDGTLVNVSVSVATLRDESGKIIGLSAIARDITELEASRRTMHELRARMAGAFENAPIGMAIVATDGRFMDVNRSLCTLLRRPAEELVGQDFQSITHPDDLKADVRQVERMLSGEISTYEMEKRYLLPDGGKVWGQLCVSLVRDTEGVPLHFVSQIKDITERKESEAQVRQQTERLGTLSLRDPLTGLSNHREFSSALEREVERARRYGHDLSLVMFDIEGFREINAELGRPRGDEVLRSVSAVISDIPRLPDLAARVAGDEFALLLPHTDEAGARTVAGRICRTVAALDGMSLRLAHGIAALADSDERFGSLLLRAEAALRAAKDLDSMGRNAREGMLRPRARKRIERTLGLAREQFGMDVTLLSEFIDGRQICRAIEGDRLSFGINEGDETPLAETYCQRLVAGRTDGLIPDAATDPGVRDLPATTEAGIGSYAGVPIRLSNGALFGTLCGLSHEPKPALGRRDRELLEYLGESIATILEHDVLELSERQAAVELSGVHALVAALEARDEYTGEHSRTVVALAVDVAEVLGLTREQIGEVEQVAILHDIGKVGIPDSVLQKPGPLSEDEWALMRQHPAIGERIIASTESLAHLAPAIRAEHERFDGDGYPDSLRGAAIPIASRITLACDAFHAMCSDRPYRAALSEEAARAELLRCSGTQFDPNVIEALAAVIDRSPSEKAAGALRR